MLIIDKSFVQKWSNVYDERFSGGKATSEEIAIRDWLNELEEPKYLNKKYFMRLGIWKTARAKDHYKENDEEDIIDTTRTAYTAGNALVKLKLLMTLSGVGVAVASTIIHFLQPSEFPIFDYHCRYVLVEAGFWKRDKDDASARAWIDYVEIMRQLAGNLKVSLRELDKAMFAYDKRDTYCTDELSA